MHKKIIQIDLDGVLNNYNGNYKTNEIAQLKDSAFGEIYNQIIKFKPYRKE